MKRDRIKYVLGAGVFVISLGLYLSTMAPTVSFWDCGEFIATSYILGVPHPPGSPLFILMGRIFGMLPTAADPALRVNLMSPLAGAFANLLVFLIIIELVKLWRKGLDGAWDKLVAYSGGVIGALAFAATDSHWFNVAETEVYAISTMATALVVWLIFRWAEHSEEQGHERYLLIIAYIMGLAIGVHLLNLLALPVIALVIYYRKYPFRWDTFFATVALTLGAFLVIYLGIIKGLPKLMSVSYLGGTVGFYLVAILVIAVFLGAWWAVRNRRQTTAVALMAAALILVGYSSYSMIYIRANQDPAINENDPNTPARFVSYLERKQYGSHSILDRASVWEESKRTPGAHIAPRTNSPLAFVWEYQIKYMYLRYFHWQFLGKKNHQIDPTQFLMLPFLLGLFGMVHHFQRDGKRALVVLTLFLMTGLAIILYLNQPDPQPRERDYSYVGSFMAFSVWIGLGASGILELIQDSLRPKKPKLARILAYTVSGLLLIGVPIQMMAKNYHTHNRTGNYVAWDYSYDLLQTIDPNGIVFTNGDNDTFPLWYLQEVEGIRKDVKVVNLSLLNTHWYIKQLRDYQPEILPASFSNDLIDRLYPMQFSARTIELPVPTSKQNPDGKIQFKLEPTLGGDMIRVSDIMILRILEANFGKRPIYFALTVPSSNMVNLDGFLRFEGLAERVMPYKVEDITDPDILKTNLFDKYQYRNFNDPSVYYNDMTTGLLQNLRSVFYRLAFYYYQHGEKDQLLQVLEKMQTTLPAEVIPYRRQELYLEIGRLFDEAGRPEILKERLAETLSKPSLSDQRRVAYAEWYIRYLNDYAAAGSVLADLYARNPNDGQIVGNLIRIYEHEKRWRDAFNIVNQWVQTHPADSTANQLLRRYEAQMKQPDSSGVNR